MSWPIRVLHLGLGRFHRAHQALYYQDLYEQHNDRWGVAAFSMRSPDARDEMRLAHNQYPVAIFPQRELRKAVSIRSSYFIGEDRDAFLDLFARVDLVTLTVTEKAYAHGSDLYEHLYAGFARRRMTAGGLTVLSCDNLLENGRRLADGVFAYARERGDSSMIAWLEKNVSFPCSMVDRIVPALTPERLRELQRMFGTDSRELIATEDFTQWVIEDRFLGARPPLDLVGAQFVDDVRPFEAMKLRLLNASHSLIAYAGLLAGYRFVHEAIRDPLLRAQVSMLYSEVRPLIDAPVDLDAYCARLLARFDNPELPHQLKQIAMDGSAKLKQRIIPSLTAARARALPHSALDATLDAWARYCYSNTPDDPRSGEINALKSLDFAAFKSALLRLLD